MFRSLPNDVLIVIRSYLIAFGNSEQYVYLVNQFVRQESERSWRNFLCASNCQYWKSIRKETMIWSLNGMAFKKYLKNMEFRRYINERMSVPAQQLLCHTFEARKGFASNNRMIDAIATSALCRIHIHDFRAREIPSSERLQFLSLHRCSFLKRLGEYPQLIALQLTGCPMLKRIRNMERLEELYLCSVNEHAMFQFPYEQLSKLHIVNNLQKSFADSISHRLKSVKRLDLSYGGTFTPDMCPKVVKLRLCDWSSINLIGLHQLKHLSIYSTPVNQIYGKEEIYPQLKTFEYFSRENWDSFNYHPERFPNVEVFTLQLAKGHSGDESITLSEKVRSFEINLPVSNISSSRGSSSKPFHHLQLSQCSTIDVFKFTNVQILSLGRSPGVEDVSIFQNIPYLTIFSLSSVKDFSSLGKQKYLSIAYCDGLSDEALSGFGNVIRLSIDSCRGISEVKGLEKTQFLQVHGCYELTTVVLAGKDYVQVSIEKSGLETLEIPGRVYSLEVRGCREFYKQRGGLRNCEYWNGKPVHECHWN
jgi:hypothetical protein